MVDTKHQGRERVNNEIRGGKERRKRNLKIKENREIKKDCGGEREREKKRKESA
jgi:hypothetical protein